jgi:nitroimidazol reductase NimA-like FMN-containing flavoprotein (pyridoxamine 5'-phosphate oxidase superfamily)
VGVLRELTYDDCLRRLDAGGVGRVAITEHALPAIVPVNFVRSGPRILFRTGPDGMLAHGCDGTVVAFEIDGVDPDGAAGWSVLVVGTARLLDVRNGDDADAADRAGLTSAVSTGRDQYVAVSLGQVSGREVLTRAHNRPAKTGLWSQVNEDVAL